MLEFFNAAFQPTNIILTVLMILVSLYWLTVVIGVLDIDFLDFDVDADFDVDVDVDIDVDVDVDIDVDADIDADVDADVDAGGGLSGLANMLSWFNLGKVPFMILFSITIFTMWMTAILLNHYTGNTSVLISYLLHIPLFILGLFVTKIVSIPLVPLFKSLNFKGEDKIDLEGKICTVLLSVKGKEKGQAEITVGDKHFNIPISSIDGHLIRKGEKAIIVEKEEGKYFIKSMDLDRLEE